MSTIVLGGGQFRAFDARTLRAMYAFRHQVFSGKLDWEVDVHDGLEFDLFDTMNPVYMLAKNQDGNVQGCWRLMPTTDAYMLRDTFPELLCGNAPPVDSRTWELSRFAVATNREGLEAQAPLNDVTMGMIRRLYEFARTCEIDRFVTVTSVALERLLKRTGLPISRIGNGKAQRIGRVLTVACNVEINQQFAEVVYPVSAQDDLNAAA